MKYDPKMSINELKNYRKSEHFSEVINLVSFPRSGNTFTRYILENFTGYRSMGYVDSGADAFPISDLRKGQNWNENGIIRKYHLYNEIPRFDNKPHGKTILLLRHPVEACLRRDKNNVLPQYYYEIVQDFLRDKHDYDSLNFLILTYEELVGSTLTFLEKLHSFVDKPIMPVNEFYADIENHRKQSIKAYSAKLGQTSITKGSHPMAHSNDITDLEFENIWNTILRKSTKVSPDIFDLFVSLYGEDGRSSNVKASV